MKILVLGATGMAGHTISIYFKEQGHEVVAFSRKPFPYCENILGDIYDSNKLTDVIVNGAFDAVINCVGILNQVAEMNKHNAVYLNSYLPHFLSSLTANLPTRIIHMSTDCVFSGHTGGYSETSLRDGDTFYDRSKALGEIENDKDLTFRNSVVGPDMNPNGIGLFNWFMQAQGEISGYKKAIWTGVTSVALAKGMEKALEGNLTGLYNLVNNDTISKYEMLQLFNKHFRSNAIKINPKDTVTLDKSLICTRKDFDYNIPSYEEMFIELKQWVMAHQDLYPHYKLD